MRNKLIYLFLALAFIGAQAHADVINTYSLSSTFVGADACSGSVGNEGCSTINGLLEIDVTTGVPIYGSFTASLQEFSFDPVVVTSFAGDFGPFKCVNNDCVDNPNNIVITLGGLYLVTLQPLTGAGTSISICNVSRFGSSSCPSSNFLSNLEGRDDDESNTNVFDAPLTAGSIVEVSSVVTPEPSSFILFGTGVLGAFGVVRRKLVMRRA
jgi:PEP-CTERM motif